MRGRWNEVFLLDEDPDRIAHGRELGAASPAKPAAERGTRATVARTDGMERLTLESPFADGRLVRILTLYQEVPRVDCETRFEGVSVKNRLVGAAFGTDGEGRAAVFGERFGAIVRSKGGAGTEFRTLRHEDAVACGVGPALRWFALSPNDHVRAGREKVVALGPCAVIAGPDPVLERAADSIQTALTTRSIPVAVYPDVLEAPGPPESGSTQFANHTDDLPHGTAMRIVVGSPEQNVFCRSLALRLPDTVVTRFNERLVDGTALLCFDDDVPEGSEHVPTLILAGHTLGATKAMADAFSASLSASGTFAIAPEDFVGSGAPEPETGVAVLVRWPTLAAAAEDTLSLLFAHGSAWIEEGPLGSIEPGALDGRFSYALYPFHGTWRTAGVSRVAHAYGEPFVAIQSGVHVGSQPCRMSFVEPKHLGWIVTAVCPAQPARAAWRTEDPNPANAFLIRGYEWQGLEWDAETTVFGAPSEAHRVNLRGKELRRLTANGNRIAHRVAANRIETIRVHPPRQLRGESAAEAEPKPAQYGPVFSRYWRHNVGAAPADRLPVGVFIAGTLDDNTATVAIVVANNTSDATISGTVTIEASEGWSVAPRQFAYDLRSGTLQRQEIAVLRTMGAGRTGGIIASTEYAGQTYRDVLQLDENPLDFEVERSGNEVRVTVENLSALEAAGFVEIVAPPAFWPELENSARSISPRRQGVALSPFAKQGYIFLMSDAEPAPWLVAKLAVNGRVLYAAVPQ